MTTTNRKRTTTRKPATNVLRLDRQENVDAIQALIDDREPLFSIGDQTFTIPKKSPAAWTIMATKLALEAGDNQAVEYALQKMLGEEGYKALSECETLTLTDFQVIRDAIIDRVFGAAPKS